MSGNSINEMISSFEGSRSQNLSRDGESEKWEKVESVLDAQSGMKKKKKTRAEIEEERKDKKMKEGIPFH